ncbi:replication protein A 70 kDa DNA-binding subunit C-like [Apium graveolens]|uniref:replication protein A 70 kDa DNA-binding subunit C-like n=1 Tax=Apium graveolens TaxID=4045 RepID=UPI003D7A4D1C
MESFDRLSNLDKASTNWKIKVRVTRIWANMSLETNSLKGYNLILLDDDDNHVHAFSYHNIWNGFSMKIVEGGVFDQFAIKDPIGNLKPVQSTLCIRFIGSTTVRTADDDGMIPSQKFVFLDLGDLFAEANKCLPQQQPKFAIDIIRVVEEYEGLNKLHTRYGDRDIVKFRICDSNNAHKVTVWGDLVVSFNNEMAGNPKKPIIAIITSSVQIGTLPSTHLYINLDDEFVNDMRQRLLEEGYIMKRDKLFQAKQIELVPTLFEKLSLKDLNENLTYDHLKKRICCTFKIIKVDEETNWWFYSCNKCLHNVERIGTVFKCTQCPQNIPVSPKRFRIMVLAKDETFACNIVLNDRVSRRVLGTSAAKVVSDYDKDSSKAFLEVIKSLVGRLILVELGLTKSNVVEDNNIFYADNLYEPMMNTPTPSESPILSEDYSINIGFEYYEGDDDNGTPGSAKSVTKKIKKPGMDDHQHLSDLNATQIAWTLKVRVTRMWRSLNGHGEVSRHNLILLDCEV